VSCGGTSVGAAPTWPSMMSRSKSQRSGRERPVLIGLAMLATGLVLAAGPEPPLWGASRWSPYELLMKWLPGSPRPSIRAPDHGNVALPSASERFRHKPLLSPLHERAEAAAIAHE